jgi:hypothetical protein
MEKRINDKVSVYVDTFKSTIKTYIEDNKNMQFDDKSELLKMVYDLDRLQITKEDFAKRKRCKSVVPFYNRCIAKKACGEQCTRKKQTSSEFCGTHDKNRPHGVINSNTGEETVKNIELEIWLQEINGINYFIDKNNNIYKSEDIIHNSKTPQIIAKYEKEGNVYKFVTSYAS